MDFSHLQNRKEKTCMHDKASYNKKSQSWRRKLISRCVEKYDKSPYQLEMRFFHFEA
jgi:hypothetical protein